ncbi:hypothetical protein INT47_006958 [Mucor saturninus]|uniref:Uncharacterized protein n=1 Tax=Mucor saturninus TaxID=64648 RepID=A0A8H7QSV1_9FUNG|nr:hypothetical protein INT47_006958 [Mucor saturninus]
MFPLRRLLCELTHFALLFSAFFWLWAKFGFFFLLEKIPWFFSSSLLAVCGDKKQCRVAPEPIGEVYVCFGRGIIPLTTFKNNPGLFGPSIPLPVVPPVVVEPSQDCTRGPLPSVPSHPTIIKKEQKCYSLDCACVVGMPCLSDGLLPSFASVLPVRPRFPSFAFGCEALTQAWLSENSSSFALSSSVAPRAETSRSHVAPTSSRLAVSSPTGDNALSAVSSPLGDNAIPAVSSSFEDNAFSAVSSSFEDNAFSAVSSPLGDNAIPAVSSSFEDNASFFVAPCASKNSGVSGGSPPLSPLTSAPFSSGFSALPSSPVWSPRPSSLDWSSFPPSPVVSSVPASGLPSFPPSPELASAPISPGRSSAPASPGLSFAPFALFGVEMSPPSSPAPRISSVFSPGASSPGPSSPGPSSPRRPFSALEEENDRDRKRIRARF